MSNKTSDKEVASLEIVIKDCRENLKLYGEAFITASELDRIENILAEREQMLKEIEKYPIHLTDEQYRKVIENAQMDTLNDRVIAHKFAVMQQQICEKDNRIKELEEELEKANRQLDLDYVEENFIPKQKVKGKLKELKIERDKIYKEFIESNRLDKQLHVQGIYLDAQIIILQELLEGERK